MRSACLATILSVCVLLGAVDPWKLLRAEEVRRVPPACERIVALAPSLTEVAFAIGLGPQLVATARYSTYPPAARSLPIVGGFLDPNVEAVLSHAPSKIIALAESEDRLRSLGTFKIKPDYFDHRSIAGILDSITALGNRCGQRAESSQLRSHLEDAIKSVRQRTSHLRAPRAMIVVGGESSQGNLRNLFISGRDGMYSELLTIARAENVFSDMTAMAGTISLERIIALAPEVIIEVQPPSNDRPSMERAIRKAWSQLPMLPAVQQGRVALLDADYATIPGPRFHLLLEDLVRVLHPAGA